MSAIDEEKREITREVKNVLEQKRKNGIARVLHREDAHVYNNSFNLGSRANLNHPDIFGRSARVSVLNDANAEKNSQSKNLKN